MGDPLLDTLHGLGPVEIRMRHEPGPSQRKLIEALGGRIVIDPSAPACCTDCKGSSVSGSVFQRTDLCPDCKTPIQLGTHSDCPSFRVGSSNGVDGRDAPLVRAVAKEDRPCKRCGAPARKPPVTNGPYAYLCDEHYAEQRTKMSQAQYDANAKRGRGREPAAETESPSPETGSHSNTPPPAAPPSPPPVAPPATPERVAVTNLSMRLGSWEIDWALDGDCRLAHLESGDIFEHVTLAELEQLPRLLAEISDATRGASD